jgi:hypothetical protein
VTDDTAFDGVLCRAGQPVAFWGSGGVRSCTLAKDTPAVASCSLAAPVEVHVPCAAGSEIEIVNARLISCTLSAVLNFDGLEIAVTPMNYGIL